MRFIKPALFRAGPFRLLTSPFLLLHSAQFIFVVGDRCNYFLDRRSANLSVSYWRQSRCEELSNGSIIPRAMVSSGARTARMCSSTTPQSLATVIALCRKEIRWSLKSSKVRKGRKLQTCKKQANERAAVLRPVERPLCRSFLFPAYNSRHGQQNHSPRPARDRGTTAN